MINSVSSLDMLCAPASDSLFPSSDKVENQRKKELFRNDKFLSEMADMIIYLEFLQESAWHK